MGDQWKGQIEARNQTLELVKAQTDRAASAGLA